MVRLSIARRLCAVSLLEIAHFHMPCFLVNDDFGDISVTKEYKIIEYLR